jgi:hypothetical protein
VIEVIFCDAGAEETKSWVVVATWMKNQKRKNMDVEAYGMSFAQAMAGLEVMEGR